jgi:hypothetical protein
MRSNNSVGGAENAIKSYFNKACMPTQQETLGLIVSEILIEGRKLSRLAICTKLLRRVEQTENEDESAHYNELISLFFER